MRGRTPLLLSALVLSHAALVSGCGGRADEAAPLPSSDIIRSKNTAASPHASGPTKLVAATPAPPTSSAATPAASPTPSAGLAPSASADPGNGDGIGLGDLDLGDPGAGDPGVGLGAVKSNPRKAPRPAIKLGAATVKGGLPSDVVSRIVRQQLGQFRKCYDDAKKTDAKIGSGTAALEFTIEKTGSASGVKATTTLADAKVGTCFGDAAAKLTFPAPTDNQAAKVTVPFTITAMHATVNGKETADVTADDVKAALTEAGWTDIVVTPPKDAPTPIVITAKKGESKLTLTFVPAKRGEKDPTVADDQKTKLNDTGAVFDDGLYLAIVVEGATGADKKAADELYAKVVKTEELKSK